MAVTRSQAERRMAGSLRCRRRGFADRGEAPLCSGWPTIISLTSAIVGVSGWRMRAQGRQQRVRPLVPVTALALICNSALHPADGL